MGGLASGTGNKRAPLDQRGDDLYETPVEAVTALLRAETLPPVIWEPACGPGAIVRTLRAAEHQVYATDLVDYASPDQDCAGWDFLMERQLPLGVHGDRHQSAIQERRRVCRARAVAMPEGRDAVAIGFLRKRPALGDPR